MIARPPPRDESGTILLLTLGCVTLVLMLVVVVVDASAVFLARRSLAAQADGASIAAVQSVSRAQVYAHGAGSRLPLAQVQDAVARYRGGGHPPALAATVTHEQDGDAVVVTGRRAVHLPFADMFGIGPVTVTATARASALRLTGDE